MHFEQHDIELALKDGSFRPHFQPLVSIRTGKLHGFEMLARWSHAEQGWIPPSVFIPLAERDGWIDRLTEVLFRRAFESMARLQSCVALSVNVSPVQLRGAGLPNMIRSLADEAGLDASRLVVEITESALAEDIDHARVIATALKDMGCRLALDDFGTGYSSLTNLQSLPFDELKVDQSFVRGMTERRDSRKIVSAVVGLGHSLGLETVAEGVETAEQAQMLQWLGCDLVQGWLYGRPLPEAELSVCVEEIEAKLPVAQTLTIEGLVSRGSLDASPTIRLAQLQAIYDGTPAGLAFLDRNLRYRMVNRRLANMNGKPMEDHIGRCVSEMIPDFFPMVEPYIRRAMDGEAIDGVELTKPGRGDSDGSTLLLSYQPATDEAGEVIGVSVAIVDLSPMRRAERAKRETEENFRNMMDLIPQIPWIIDPEGRALDVSQRWLALTGMKEDAWRGFGWFEALHPDDVVPTREAILSATQANEAIDLTYRVRSAESAPWKRLRSRGSAKLNSQGEVVCWYGCLDELD